MPSEILIITRNYPPQTGGLENYSFNLVRELRRLMPVRVIALNKSKAHLIWFLPMSFLKGLMAIYGRSIRRVHLCDGFLATLGLLLKILSNARVSVSVHGLDITFPNRVYQRVIPYCLARLDENVCVSRATRDECICRGVPAQRCSVIPNGVNIEEIYLPVDRNRLLRQIESVLRRPLGNRKILLTVGRLVKRKGISWFVENVMPQVGEEYIYVVVGSGPELPAINKLISAYRLTDKVVVAGRQPDHIRNRLLNVAEAFIMPNIAIPGDVEGFGIAALEAGACGLPVIASDLQGIRDAVIDGVTGYLVRERDAKAFPKFMGLT
jgi:phosphatidyl-myo-inositol dimannoside synthase